MIAVKTMSGRLWHLVDRRNDARTFCGLVFAEGVDELEELQARHYAHRCSSCVKVKERRNLRNARSHGWLRTR